MEMNCFVKLISCFTLVSLGLLALWMELLVSSQTIWLLVPSFSWMAVLIVHHDTVQALGSQQRAAHSTHSHRPQPCIWHSRPWLPVIYSARPDTTAFWFKSYLSDCTQRSQLWQSVFTIDATLQFWTLSSLLLMSKRFRSCLADTRSLNISLQVIFKQECHTVYCSTWPRLNSSGLGCKLSCVNHSQAFRCLLSTILSCSPLTLFATSMFY